MSPIPFTFQTNEALPRSIRTIAEDMLSEDIPQKYEGGIAARRQDVVFLVWGFIYLGNHKELRATLPR